MLRNIIGSKILIVFSDPGGAKPCLSVASKLTGNEVLVISDRSYGFYQDFGIAVKIVNQLHELDEKISSFAPDLILTGTSYTSRIEKKTIALAKQKKIKVISFIDHWTSMLARFRDDQGTVTLPNVVYVIDEKARHLAIEEGIPLELLKIHSNPYHSWLRKWKPRTNRDAFLKRLNIDPNRKIILFAPDPLSNINGIETYGYDEIVALKKLLNIINLNSRLIDGYHFLLKTHPNQVLHDIRVILEDQASFDIVPPDIDTNESIYFSDCIIGFFSAILIEAELMNKAVIRYIPKSSIEDPFRDKNVGIVADEDNLLEEILKLT